MAKYLQVLSLLQQRIRHGDYLLKEFPTDRQLSAEFEVDARTARKAVAQLIHQGLLIRRANGRPAVGPALLMDRAPLGNREPKGAPHRSRREARTTLRVALLAVAYPSPYTWRWQRAITQSVERRGGLFRPVNYVHLDDAIVGDTLEGFDALFLGLPGCDPSPHLLRRLERSKRPVVFLDADVSGEGFPSVWLASPGMTTRLLDHLASVGRRRVACLNTQPHNDVTERRIAVWREWAGDDRAGLLVDRPVEPFGSPVERAYRVTLETLDAGGFHADSLLCCTSAAAKGAYRAFHERGVEVGRDLAVCSCDDGAGEAPYFVPSLTSLRDPDPMPYLDVCLDWMERGGRDWQGPLLVQPHEVPIYVGESTGTLPRES